MLKRVVILMMTNVITQIANRIQKPPSGAGFLEVVKNVGWCYGKYHVSSLIRNFVFLCQNVGSIKGYFL